MNQKEDYTQGTLEGRESMRVISIRQHFAAMAMQGLCERFAPGQQIILAEYAVQIADALIDALNKEKEAAI